jgi:putative endonuclease
MNNHILGKQGEKIAEKYLRENSITILAKNFYTCYGELDLIGQDAAVIVFFEVKYRRNKKYGLPEENISKSKIDKIIKSAQIFLCENNLSNQDCRFDVLTIIGNIDLNAYEINWLKNVCYLTS